MSSTDAPGDVPSTALVVAMPRPPAQVQPFVDAFGPELTVTFLLTFGGSEIYVATDPTGRAEWHRFVGDIAAARLAAVAYRPPRRVPLANRWLAKMLAWQGFPQATIARRLRITDVAVRTALRDPRVR